MISFYHFFLTTNVATSSNWCETIVVACIGAVASGLVFLCTNDFNARIQCCHSFYELKKLLVKLAFYRNHPNDGEDGYVPILMNIEKTVEKLDVEASGLLFQPPNLNYLISKTGLLFKALDPQHNNPDFRPAYTASNLMYAWAPSKTMGSF